MRPGLRAWREAWFSALVAARGVSQRGGASRCGSESAAKGAGSRSRPFGRAAGRWREPAPEQAEATEVLSPGRSARSLPEGRSLALRERERGEGSRLAVEALWPSGGPVA